MAGDYYSLQEVAKKLGKSEEDIRNMVKDGKLHEFRDGSNVIFKIAEVDAIVSKNAELDISGSEIELVLDETGEISLDTKVPESPAPGSDPSGGFGLSSLGDITNADTNVGTTGINVLGETDDEYKLSDDSQGDTKIFDDELGDLGDIGDLDADSNLESVGSGSGLLDLSLQADDTSLGAVLDDILPAAIDGESEGMELQDDMAEEADKIFDQSGSGSSMPVVQNSEPVSAMPSVAAVARPSATIAASSGGGVLSVAMFLGIIAIIYAAIVITAGLREIVPGILKSVEKPVYADMGLFWFILFALMLVVAIVGVSSLAGGGKKTTRVKAEKKTKKKQKKEKKKK